ncbi:hypothetical protein OSB04_027444 [Centaurea solstitialis]|uniref:Uncharacterized protein n=1 Tax=Centaurea solstitialis TaxID=347529 RepID=A0AA38SYU8_9ASTR|nr:hypothetical protein OSB04_027444 [Centaurea solstitialis]
MEGWESNYFYEESNRITPPSSSSFLSTQSFMMCKQELEAAENLNLAVQYDHDQLIQLPHLESPSLESIINTKNINDEYDTINKVRDWRDLDKFVASQLSQDPEIDQCVGEGVSLSFERNHDSDLSYMFLQCGQEENGGGGGVAGFLSSTRSDDQFDVESCIYDNL